MTTITEWQQTLHQLNVEKGFYDYQKDIAIVEQAIAPHGFKAPGEGLDSDTEEALQRLLADYKQAMLERKLLLVIGELCEAHDELRSGHAVNEVYYNGLKPEGFGVETADAHIRLFDLEAAAGIDAGTNILEKHGYNKTRPYKHSRSF